MAAANAPRRVLAALPSGTVAVAAGLAVLGLGSYAYLGIAARTLTPTRFAELGVVWTILFTLGPGLFLSLEQEVGRHLASVPGRPVLRLTVQRAALLGAALAVLLTAITLAAAPFVLDRLLGGDVGLFAASIGANAALFVVHLSRGVLAGSDRFGRYGVQVAVDGLLRVLGAAVLAAFAVRGAGWFGAVLVVSQLVAVGVSVARLHPAPPPPEAAGHDATWGGLLHGIGWLVVGTLFSQVLVNAGTLVVKALAPPSDPVAGAFLTASTLARVPLFLFAALQASLLPRISALAASGDVVAVRATTVRTVLALLGIGGLVTAALAAAGPTVSRLLFGPAYGGGRLVLTLLAFGVTAYMVALALGQTLLALRATRLVASGWAGSVVVAALVIAGPGALTTRVSVSFLVGSTAAAIGFGAVLRHRLRIAAAPVVAV